MTNRLLRVAPIAACIAVASSAGLAAESGDKVWKHEGREFACAGVGSDVQNNPQWNGYPLKIVFTNEDGDYLGDVSVTLENSKGDVIVAAQCNAPWFLASVENGSYTADVVADGKHARTVSFAVEGKDQTKIFVPFSSVAGT